MSKTAERILQMAGDKWDDSDEYVQVGGESSHKLKFIPLRIIFEFFSLLEIADIILCNSTNTQSP